MKRLDYFKDVAIAIIVLVVLGVLSLTQTDEMSTAWRVIVPTFFFGIPTVITIYGFLKYKK